MKQQKPPTETPLKWRDNAESPFWEHDGPAELQLWDETTEQVHNARKAKKQFAELVRFWRLIPAELWNS